MASKLQTVFAIIQCLGGVASVSAFFRPSCPSGWILNAQSCWMAIPDKKIMTDAQAGCKRMDSNSAVPNSKTENDFVFGLFKETWPNAGIGLWLGCTAALPNNTLTCIESLTGSERFYTFVASDRPNRRCLMMDKVEGSRWSLVNCGISRRTICERPATRLTAKTLQCSAISLNHAGHTGSYCLLDHTFSVTQVKSPMQCCIACFKDLNCHSFNLSGNTCQLNNVTISQVDQGKYLKRDENCGYFETKWA
ncbi:uncharacterized protein LOC119740533 [Patiria miniata]|uniref:C-type lectin domain-containing protein n=1 Tax=Patiria miniata TaxID=46514 RepID=A0A914B766_PATMI|nr:uncharacterized protein LOC119740533 [Patiria miniata]